MDGSVRQLSHEELVRLVMRLQAELTELREENRRLKQRISELEKKNPTQRLQQSYSLSAEEKRRENATSGGKRKHGASGSRQQSERRGRRPTQDKINEADQHELILPEGFDLADCRHVIDRPVWRIRNGRATRVVYEIWRGPGGETPRTSTACLADRSLALRFTWRWHFWCRWSAFRSTKCVLS